MTTDDPTDQPSGPATTAEEAMEREAQVDGHVSESAYAPTETDEASDR